jgi:hypothetical protein
MAAALRAGSPSPSRGSGWGRSSGGWASATPCIDRAGAGRRCQRQRQRQRRCNGDRLRPRNAAPGAGKSVALGNIVSHAALCTDVSVGSNCHRPSRRCTSCSWRPDPRGPRSPSRRCRASRGTARTSGSGSGDQRGMELMRTTHPRSVIAQQSCPGSPSMKVLRRSWWEWTFAPMDPSNQNRSGGESACAHALMYKAFSRSWLLRVGLALRPLLRVVGSQNPPMAADVRWPGRRPPSAARCGSDGGLDGV